MTTPAHDIFLSNHLVLENSAAGIIVGMLSTPDPDSSNFTFTLLDDAEGQFVIDGTNLLVATPLDFEEQSFWIIKVQVTDSDNQTFEDSLAIAVRDIDGVTITGSQGNDVIGASKSTIGHKKATPEQDTIRGRGGNDNIHGAGGDDTIRGGTGNDKINGGTGMDQLFGNAGADKLWGDDGHDGLFGLGGNDTLHGGAGNDRLVGGRGRDFLEGGSGDDSFDFVSIKDSGAKTPSRDIIADFEHGDLINLFHIDANTTNAAGTNDAFTFIGTNVNFGRIAGQLRAFWTLDGHGQIVEGDVNGDGKADFSIKLEDPTHAISFGAGDFVL